MENDTVMAHTLLNDEEETDALVPGEANAEDEQADGADQVASSALPVSAVSSTFATSTIDIRLQVQPEDGHPDGRRIRNIIAVNEKTLRIGALRASQLHTLIALLRDLDMEQTMEHFAHFLAILSEQQTVTTPKIESPATPTRGEKTERPDQKESSPVITIPENTITEPHASQPMASTGAPEKGLPSPETKPEQLALF